MEKELDKNDKLMIVLQYALGQIDEEELNWLLINELSQDEKTEILLDFDEERIKSVLMNMGFDEHYLETL